MTGTFLISLVWTIFDYDDGGCWVTAIEDGMQPPRYGCPNVLSECYKVQVIKDTPWLSRQFGLSDHIESTIY